jgi:hypothetical protein
MRWSGYPALETWIVAALGAGISVLLVANSTLRPAEVLPPARCRTQQDCPRRQTCRVGGTCAAAGVLRLPVRIPGYSGRPTWLHVLVRDRAGELPPREIRQPVPAGGEIPLVLENLAEGIFDVSITASEQPQPHAPCGGDLHQALRVRVSHGFVGIDGTRRRSDAALLLVQSAQRPCDGNGGHP